MPPSPDVADVADVADILAALADHASRGRVRRSSSHGTEPNAVGAVCGSSNASYWSAGEGTPPVADETLAAIRLTLNPSSFPKNVGVVLVLKGIQPLPPKNKAHTSSAAWHHGTLQHEINTPEIAQAKMPRTATLFLTAGGRYRGAAALTGQQRLRYESSRKVSSGYV